MQNLEELIKRAVRLCGCKIAIERDIEGRYSVILDNDDTRCDRHNMTITEFEVYLKELATPKFVTVTFPVDKARQLVAIHWDTTGVVKPLAVIIQAELDKLEQP